MNEHVALNDSSFSLRRDHYAHVPWRVAWSMNRLYLARQVFLFAGNGIEYVVLEQRLDENLRLIARSALLIA